MTLSPLYPDFNLQDLFSEPVLETEFLEPGSEGHSTDVWRVRTIRKTCVVRLSTPRKLTGPFWAGCERLFGRGSIDLEATRVWLDYIRSTGTFKTPRVYTGGAYGRLNYMVVENMPGEKLESFTQLSEEGREELGRDLANLHFHLFDYTGGLPSGTGRPVVGFPTHLADTLIHLAEDFFADQPDLSGRLEDMVATARRLEPNPFGVPIMPDIDPTQFLQRDGRITALVDVDACAIGPRELDLIALEYVLDPATAPAFMRGYESVLPIPNLQPVRPVYRYLYRLMEIQDRLPLNEWLARPVLY